MKKGKGETKIVFINGRIRSEWDGNEVACKGCGVKIGYAKTPSGKNTPFNLDLGNTSHFMSCPYSKDFRRG